MKDKIIEKLEEIIKFYDTHCHGLGAYKSNKRQRLRNELASLQEEQEQNINYNFAIFDISKIYQFTIQDINTNEIIMIDEDTERKAFRKAFRYFGELKLRDRDLSIIKKLTNIKHK